MNVTSPILTKTLGSTKRVPLCVNQTTLRIMNSVSNLLFNRWRNKEYYTQEAASEKIQRSETKSHKSNLNTPNSENKGVCQFKKASLRRFSWAHLRKFLGSLNSFLEPNNEMFCCPFSFPLASIERSKAAFYLLSFVQATELSYFLVKASRLLR